MRRRFPTTFLFFEPRSHHARHYAHLRRNSARYNLPCIHTTIEVLDYSSRSERRGLPVSACHFPRVSHHQFSSPLLTSLEYRRRRGRQRRQKKKTEKKLPISMEWMDVRRAMHSRVSFDTSFRFLRLRVSTSTCSFVTRLESSCSFSGDQGNVVTRLVRLD